MPKIDLNAIPHRTGSTYPAPHNAGFEKRRTQQLGKSAGLTQFGANLVTLAPGGMASQRHWHQNQDEFLVVVAGELVQIDDHGETVLRPGDCCAYPAGDETCHHIVNKSDANGSFVVVGTHTPAETAWYSDIDMKVAVTNGHYAFTKKDGSAF